MLQGLPAEELSAWAGEPIGGVLLDRRLVRQAQQAARAEHSAGYERPSGPWSRQWGLMLGAARLLDADPVRLL